MSLILEALRKSEAERRRGELPGLHAELPPVQTLREGPPRWWWLVLTAGLVVALTIFWSVRGSWRPAPAVAASAATQPLGPPAVGMTVDATAPPASADAGARSRTDQRAVVTAATAEASLASGGTRTDTPAVADRPVPGPPVPAAIAGPTTAAVIPPTLAEPVASASHPAPLPRSPPPAAVAPRPAPAVTLEAAAASTAAIESGVPIALADLGADERRALPALKISMHMWNEAPAQRFVIIDGNRVTEGSRIGDAVVDRITPDGVLLAWQGRQLRLPIR